jgi:threonine aldolase
VHKTQQFVSDNNLVMRPEVMEYWQRVHVETDECGVNEFFLHESKLPLGEGVNKKLVPEAIEAIARKHGDIHHAVFVQISAFIR